MVNKKVELEITGVISGDYESACVDVSKEEFKKLKGYKPEKFDESLFYENLYRYYSVDIPYRHIQEFGDGSVLKMKITYEIEKVGEAERKTI